MPEIRKPVHVGFNFALGAIASILLAIVIPANSLTIFFLNHAPQWLHTAILQFVPYLGWIVGGFAGGAVGGESLRKGLRVSLGFGAGFTLPAIVNRILILMVERIGSKGDATSFLILFGAGFGISFLLAGTIGALFLKKNLKTTLHIAAGFGIGGVCGGLVTSLFFILHGSLHDIRTVPTLIAGWILPFFIGGSMLAFLLRKSEMEPQKR